MPLAQFIQNGCAAGGFVADDLVSGLFLEFSDQIIRETRIGKGDKLFRNI